MPCQRVCGIDDESTESVPDTFRNEGYVCGLVKINLCCRLNHMSPLSKEMQVQLTFYQEMFDQHLLGPWDDDDDGVGSLYRVEVLDVYMLPKAIPLQQWTERRFKGMACYLEEGQKDRLIMMFPHNILPEGKAPPDCVIRLPTAFADACITKHWTQFLLPHFPAKRHPARVRWNTLGLDPRYLALEQEPLSFSSFADAPTVSSEALADWADLLRVFASTIQPRSDLEQEKYEEVEKAVLGLQRLSDELTPTAFLKTIKHLEGQTSLGNMDRRVLGMTAYKAAFLVNIMCMAGLLRTSASLCQALERSLLLILPASLREACSRLVAQALKVFPHKGTISRWRFIIDAAHMVTQRKCFESMQASGGFYLYAMCDSSTQHGREFEHIYFQWMKADEIVPLFFLVNRLITLWSDV